MSTKKELLAQIATIDETAAERLATAKKVDLELWLELNDEVEEAESKNMSKTLQKYRAQYEPSISASGRKSLNTGDEIAHLLAGLEPEAVIKVAEKVLGLEDGELMAKYDRLNRGQKRMNAGNRIRSAVKRGDVQFKDIEQALKH